MSRHIAHSAWFSRLVLVSMGLALLLLSAPQSFSSPGPGSDDFGPTRSEPFVPERPAAWGEQRDLLTNHQNRPQGTVIPAGWQSYPLYGGEMTSIVMSPVETQTVYVGTRDAGVFKTTDGGQSWQPSRGGLTFFPVRSLRIDPQHPNVLYAGTDYDGIWKSIDGGRSWTKSSSGLDTGLIVFNIVIDPENTNKVYAGLAGGIGLGIGNIYKSEDGGASWKRKDKGIPRISGS